MNSTLIALIATLPITAASNLMMQVMAEGEMLSKKQLAQENTMKKLRQHIKDVELSRKDLAAELAAERERLEEMQNLKQRLEADVGAAKSAHRVEVETERAHYEGLLAKSRASQVTALRQQYRGGRCIKDLLFSPHPCQAKLWKVRLKGHVL